MEAAGELVPAMTASNVISTRTDASTSTTGRPRALWFVAGSATAAVTGGLLAVLYIASVIGWSLEGRAPARRFGWDCPSLCGPLFRPSPRFSTQAKGHRISPMTL
jgi:hypothetical protein